MKTTKIKLREHETCMWGILQGGTLAVEKLVEEREPPMVKKIHVFSNQYDSKRFVVRKRPIMSTVTPSP